jgi:hypothetical protein
VLGGGAEHGNVSDYVSDYRQACIASAIGARVNRDGRIVKDEQVAAPRDTAAELPTFL